MSYRMVDPIFVLEACTRVMDDNNKSYDALLDKLANRVMNKQFRFFGLIEPMTYRDATREVLSDFDYILMLRVYDTPKRVLDLIRLANIEAEKADSRIALSADDAALLRLW